MPCLPGTRGRSTAITATLSRDAHSDTPSYILRHFSRRCCSTITGTRPTMLRRAAAQARIVRDPTSRGRGLVTLFARLVLALLLTASVVSCTRTPAGFKNSDVTGATFARDFKLKDPSGATR